MVTIELNDIERLTERVSALERAVTKLESDERIRLAAEKAISKRRLSRDGRPAVCWHPRAGLGPKWIHCPDCGREWPDTEE